MWRFLWTWRYLLILAACDVYLLAVGLWWAALLASAGTLIAWSGFLIFVLRHRFGSSR
jgi:hypothetical protein